MRSCALAASPAWLKARVTSSAFAVVASGETLAVKSVIGVVTLAKAPESGGSATNTSLKVWLVPKPERLPCGRR